MNFGEKVVMRILDKQKSTLPLTALGFSEENLARYRECIRQPYGMILHCGPTGSGKSMTLYSALSEINTPDINIQTAEDPIEYTLVGINQMQMSRTIGLTFARALRCYLRMDPDVILVGRSATRRPLKLPWKPRSPAIFFVSTFTPRRAVDHRTNHRDGRRAVQHLSFARLRLRAAPAAARLQELPPAVRTEGPGEGHHRKAIGWNGQVFPGQPTRMSGVRWQRLQGPRRHP